jgi:crotonobetainyl-CoA:carnitine CoA-transferase CaiB-like acyl-CoA transferase
MDHPAWMQEARFATCAAREQHSEALDAQVAAWTIQHTPQEILDRLQAAGVPGGIVQNARDLASDPQLQHRQHYVTLQHAEIGANVVDQLGFKLSHTPGGPTRPAPLLGQHNAYVYGELLGLSTEEMATLEAEGIIA